MARNLERQGFSIWLDDWERVPGSPVSRSLQEALDASAAAILIVTPEAAQSGWVQSEYEHMRARQRRGDGFRCVPLILQASEGFAFLEELFAVDFRSVAKAVDYRRKLHEVVCGLRGQSPGKGESLAGDIELPAAIEPARRNAGSGAVAGLLDDLEFQRVAAAFAQEGAQYFYTTEALLAAVRERFQGAHVRHIVPLICDDTHAMEYFGHVAARCGIVEPVADSLQLRTYLARCIEHQGPHVLVVSHMENGPDKARRDFCNQLRNLREQYEGLSVLFVGGEKLDELVFHAQQHLSILSMAAATSYDWPSATAEQMQRFVGEAGVPESEIEVLFRVTGGEPRLIADCLRRRPGMEDRSGDAYAAVISNSSTVRQWFSPFANDPVALAKICLLLGQTDLGSFDRLRDDEIRRRLYWKGALRKVTRQGVDRLAWRCESASQRGRELLRCDTP